MPDEVAEQRTETVTAGFKVEREIHDDVKLFADRHGISASEVYREACWGRWTLSTVRKEAAAIRAEAAA